MSQLLCALPAQLGTLLHASCRNCSQLQKMTWFNGTNGNINKWNRYFHDVSRKGIDTPAISTVSTKSKEGAAKSNVRRVSKDVHLKLRKEVLMNPKFSGQVTMSGISIRNMLNRQEEISRCKNDLSDLQSVEDLHTLMSDIVTLFSNYDRTRAMRAIQRECCVRLHKWNMSQILLAMDLFYGADYMAPRYHGAAFKLIDLKLNVLNVEPKDIVQLLFYATVHRSIPVSLIRQLEELIAVDPALYSPEELGLICNSFFVTNNCLHSYELLQHIASTLIHHVPLTAISGNSVLIGNYIKVLRHANYMQDKKFQNKMGDIFIELISVQDIYVSMQLYRTFTSIHYHHEIFFKKFLQFWNKQTIQQARLRFKDLVDIIWGCAVFRMKPPADITSVLLAQIEGEQIMLMREYPEYHIRGLVSLVLVHIYPYNAISTALAHPKHNHVGTLEQMFQYLLLDQTMEILCPDYRGDRLHQSWYGCRDQELRTQLVWRKGFLVVLSALQNILHSPRCVHVNMIIKYAPLPDLIMYVDGENRAVESEDVDGFDVSGLLQHLEKSTDVTDPDVRDPDVTDEDLVGMNRSGDMSIMDEMLKEIDQKRPDCLHFKPESKNISTGKVRKLLVKVLGWHQYLVNKDSIHGMHLHALDLLLNLGYEVIVISPSHARDLETMSQAKQQDFVRTEILDKFGVKY